MTPALLILVSCAVSFLITAGFLLFKGRFGQRGVVWIYDNEDMRR